MASLFVKKIRKVVFGVVVMGCLTVMPTAAAASTQQQCTIISLEKFTDNVCLYHVPKTFEEDR